MLAGIAYVLGYAIQDGLSLTPLLTTQSVQTPSRFVRWLYRRFTRRKWVNIAHVDLDEARDRIPDDGEQRARYERIITLKQVGTAVGPSFAVSGLLLLSKCPIAEFDLAVGFAACLLGVVLVCLGWIKGSQQAQFESQYGTAR